MAAAQSAGGPPGGIAEHSDLVRGRLAARLTRRGDALDPEANGAGSGERAVTTPQSRTAMLVIPTNEELEIATQTAAVVQDHQRTQNRPPRAGDGA